MNFLFLQFSPYLQRTHAASIVLHNGTIGGVVESVLCSLCSYFLFHVPCPVPAVLCNRENRAEKTENRGQRMRMKNALYIKKRDR
jgi:hypothetical protein